MNRGQILYRAAEMLDGRAAQFVGLLGGGPRARRELDHAVETLVWYAGWTDKLSQVTGTVNPGPPGYEYEIWLASALLGVTFPFLIFFAEFFQMWPLKRAETVALPQAASGRA